MGGRSRERAHLHQQQTAKHKLVSVGALSFFLRGQQVARSHDVVVKLYKSMGARFKQITKS